MAMFKSSNPTLTAKIFDKSLHENSSAFGVMSIRGTMNKFGFLLLMVMASAMYVWNVYAEGNVSTATTLMIGGAIGGFVLAIVMMFKPTWAGYIEPQLPQLLSPLWSPGILDRMQAAEGTAGFGPY